MRHHTVSEMEVAEWQLSASLPDLAQNKQCSWSAMQAYLEILLLCSISIDCLVPLPLRTLHTWVEWPMALCITKEMLSGNHEDLRDIAIMVQMQLGPRRCQ